MNSRVLRLTITSLLIVSVLCCSVSVFATDPSPVPTFTGQTITDMNQELLARYVWLTLRAWGINIQYNSFEEFTAEVEEQIITWIMEFLAGLPSSYSINQWIAPWQGDYDYWGNLRLNSSALEDIQDFADWLIQKLSLTNNSTVYVDGRETMNGITFYKFDQFYKCEDQQGNADYTYTALSVDDKNNNMYGYFYVKLNNGWYTAFTATAYAGPLWWKNTGLTYDYIEVNLGEAQAGSGNWNRRGNPTYWFALIANGTGNLIASGTHLQVANDTELNQFLASASITIEGDLGVVTGNIALPDNDINYAPGDSIIIIDNNPGYEIVEWPDSVSVNNLPAVISTNSLPKPNLSEFFQPVKAFVTMTRDSMELMIQLIYRLPVEANVCIYALMGSIILLGVIKIMREH